MSNEARAASDCVAKDVEKSPLGQGTGACRPDGRVAGFPHVQKA